MTAMQNSREIGVTPAALARKLTIPVVGMTCASCVGRVEKALTRVEGVTAAHVNLATERADIALQGPVDRRALVAAIEDAGYEVPAARHELAVDGMTCASCVGRVERALAAVPGVRTASVNLASERAAITADVSVNTEDLIAAINGAGYEAHMLQGDRNAEDHAARRDAERLALKRDLLIAAALTLPVFGLEMGSHTVPAIHDWVMGTIGMQTSWLIQLVLTAIVLFWPGLRFYRIGLPALLKGAPDMNSLVAVGTLAAFSYSLVATLAPQLLPAGTVNVYFEAAAVIVSLVLAGRYLEARAKGRTSDAIKRLVGLQPKTARIHRDGKTLELDASEIRLGDLVDVRPGERLAADGEVV
jgi:copper ion binding protein